MRLSRFWFTGSGRRALAREISMPGVQSRGADPMKFSIAFTVLVVAIAAGSSAARAGELLVVDELAETVGVYDATTGATINGSLISGLTNYPRDMKLAGGDLYITSSSGGTVGQYNATTGATINAAFQTEPGESTGIAVSGSDYYVVGAGTSQAYVNGYTSSGPAFSDSVGYYPAGVAVLGNNLFVADNANYVAGHGSIEEYNATTGALVDATFITGLFAPEGITILGNTMYVVNNAGNTDPNENTGSIGEYNATTGAAINTSLVTGLYAPVATVVVGNDFYVTSNPNVHGQPGYPNNAGVVGEYNATTGATINASLITGFQDPQGIVYMTPEPSTWIMLGMGAAALAALTDLIARPTRVLQSRFVPLWHGPPFGLGSTRAIQFLTGMANIRDVIPFARTPGSADF
jgi:hypothetical protein